MKMFDTQSHYSTRSRSHPPGKLEFHLNEEGHSYSSNYCIYTFYKTIRAVLGQKYNFFLDVLYVAMLTVGVCRLAKLTLRYAGLIVCLLSAATIGLGIADVTTNWFTKYCQNGQGSCLPITTDQALTWVAVGIWGPIQIFITGLDSIYLSSFGVNERSRLTLGSWISSFVFAPAVSIISCVEIGFKFSSGLTSTTLATASARAWFAVPLTIAVNGLLLHFLTLYLFLYTREVDAAEEAEAEIAARNAKQTPAPPPPPPPAGPPCNLPPCDPGYVADVDRLNVWAASRWMNQQGPAPTRTAVALGNTNAAYYQYPRVVLAGGN